MSFKDYELLNVVRHVEQHGAEELASELAVCAPKVETELQNEATPFTSKALTRARQLAEITGLGDQYFRSARRYKSFTLLLFAFMAVVGFFAVLQTLASSKSELNVYWLLLIILGVNFVSMLLWLIFITRNMISESGSASQSPLLLGLQKGQRLITQRSSQVSLFASWGEMYLGGRVGQWFSSKQLHAAWLMYLLGSLIALTITLAGKQFDFVWGTTILPADFFVNATKMLGVLPSMLGFSVPDAEQVLASKIAADRESIDGLRRIWASFVVGCIVIYSLIPRLIFWCWCWLAEMKSRLNYVPDWDLPYFYALRTKMLPHSSSIGVVDADLEGASNRAPKEQMAESSTRGLAAIPLPKSAYVAAFEWGRGKIPTVTLDKAINLGEINTANEQIGMLQAVKQSPQPIVMLVELERAADRGATRFLQKLSGFAELHLIVLKSANRPSDAARLAGWQAVAEKIALPLSRFHLAELS